MVSMFDTNPILKYAKRILMKNKLIFLLVVVLSWSSLNAQKIPITTKSKEALTFYKKGWQHEDRLNLDEAEKMYSRAVSMDSAFALAYLRLAMVKDNYEVRRTQLKQAVKYIDQVTEGEKLWIKGRVDFYASGYDGSKEYGYFKKLAKLYPNDEMANYLFAFVNLHHGKKDTELAIHHFKKAIKLNPDFSKPYNELAYAYLENKDYDNAKRTVRNYIALLPNAVNPLDTYAEIFMRSGEYKKSIKNYKKVLKIDSQFPWALMGITANMNFLGKHKKGRLFLERLNESGLSDYEYRHKWRAQVTSYLDEGDLDGAINVLEAQKQESTSGRNKREPIFHIYFAHLRKTRLYFENNQAVEGLKEYEQWNTYVQSNSKNESTKKRVQNLELYYLAYQAYLEKDWKLATSLLTKYETINGKIDDRSRVLKARILVGQDKLTDALIELRKNDLTNAYNQYWLAFILFKNSEYLEAKKWLDIILSTNERNDIDLALVRRKAKELIAKI